MFVSQLNRAVAVYMLIGHFAKLVEYLSCSIHEEIKGLLCVFVQLKIMTPFLSLPNNRDLKQRRPRRQQRQDLKITFAFLNKLAMISTHLVCVMWPNYPGANIVAAALKFRKRKEN